MIDLIKNYANKKAALLKLETTEKTSLATGKLFVLVLFMLFGLFFVALLSIGIGFLIGEYLGKMSYGFLIVAAFYFILLMIILIANQSIKKVIANKIIQSMHK